MSPTSYHCDGDDETVLTASLVASDMIGLGIPDGDPDPMRWLQTNFNVNGKLVFPARLRTDAKTLTLYYDIEGGARLFVSARAIGAGLIAPLAKTAITGKDAHFPLHAAVIGEGAAEPFTVPPEEFGWYPQTDATGVIPPAQPGCWETEDLRSGTLALYAKPTLPTAAGRIERRRHAPGADDHEAPLAGHTVTPALRDQIVAAARSYPDDDGALERLLHTLHRYPAGVSRGVTQRPRVASRGDRARRVGSASSQLRMPAALRALTVRKPVEVVPDRV